MCDIDTTLPENLCKTESCDDDVQEMDYGAHNETHKEDFDELQILKEEVEKLRRQLSERDQIDKANERMNVEFTKFYEYFPDFNLEQVPDEIWDKVKKGASLSAEFSLYLRKIESEKKMVGDINKKNRQMSAGAIGMSEGEKYYSPSEVKRMSPSQVKAHYDDIIESMRHWN